MPVWRGTESTPEWHPARRFDTLKNAIPKWATSFLQHSVMTVLVRILQLNFAKS